MIALFAAAQLALTPIDYTPDKPLPKLPTTRDFLAFCARDAKGCQDYTFDLIWRSTVGPQHVGYCLPENESSEAVITDKAVAWLRNHPEFDGKPTDPSLTHALEASYPCGRR
jgi:hypothetical protein